MPNHNGHWDEHTERDARNDRTDPNGPAHDAYMGEHRDHRETRDDRDRSGSHTDDRFYGRGGGMRDDRNAQRYGNDDRERMRFAQHSYHGGSALSRNDTSYDRRPSFGNDRGHDYDRYDHAFDRVPEGSHDGFSDARAWPGSMQDDQGGFGPGVQGPYGQSAYGQGSYARGISSYVPGTNHPYADREAHERYNREHFPHGTYDATGQWRGNGPRLAGPHRGKGPKNFTRSDERLKEHVNELLMEHDEIDATHVDVEVKNGEVSVTGTVEDRQQRRAIEDLVECMAGVKDVHISIKIADRDQRLASASSRSHNPMSDTTSANPNDSKKARA